MYTGIHSRTETTKIFYAYIWGCRTETPKIFYVYSLSHTHTTRLFLSHTHTPCSLKVSRQYAQFSMTFTTHFERHNKKSHAPTHSLSLPPSLSLSHTHTHTNAHTSRVETGMERDHIAT